MFCPRCGSQNEVGAANCSRCGSALPQPQAAKPPEPPAAPPAGGSVSSGDLSSSSEGNYPGGSSLGESPNYPGPPGQPPYGSPSQGYGSGGQSYGQPQGYGNSPYGGGQQGPGGGQPSYGSGPGYGSSPGYGSGPGYGGGAPAGGNVPNYMVWSICSTVAGFLFCCLIGLPLGIVAIVFSSQVSKKLAAGDYAGAVEASNKAKLWCIIATVVSVLGLILNIIFLLNGSFNARF